MINTDIRWRRDVGMNVVTVGVLAPPVASTDVRVSGTINPPYLWDGSARNCDR